MCPGCLVGAHHSCACVPHYSQHMMTHTIHSSTDMTHIICLIRTARAVNSIVYVGAGIGYTRYKSEANGAAHFSKGVLVTHPHYSFWVRFTVPRHADTPHLPFSPRVL